MNAKMSATYTSYIERDQRTPATPQQVRIGVDFDTLDEARAFVGQFPKSLRLSAHQVFGRDKEWAAVSFHAGLTADGINGGVNEAGVKRYRRYLKGLTEMGVPVEYQTPYANSYPTFDAFQEAIQQ